MKINLESVKDFVKIVSNSLTRRMLRTSLTMVGIFIGIAAVVALVSLSQGLKDTVQDQFEQMGSDKLIITYKGDILPGLSSSEDSLTFDDVDFLDSIKEIEEATFALIDFAEVSYGESKLFLPVACYPKDSGDQVLYDEFWYPEIIGGRKLNGNERTKIVTGIGYFEDNVFQRNLKIRDKLIINSGEFKIVGYYERIGNPQDDKNIFMSEDIFLELFERGEEVDSIIAKVAPTYDPNTVAEKIEKLLRKHRGLKEGNEDFIIMTAADLMEAFNQILNIIQVVLVGIAGISLIVGGIGIMNTMYTAVTERTKEIGIMKAIGARNEDILILFLIESGILGIAGGLIGVFIGMVFAKIIEFIAIEFLKTNLLTPNFSPFLIFGSLAFAFIVGSISGTLPAIQASKLQPVDALRYE